MYLLSLVEVCCFNDTTFPGALWDKLSLICKAEFLVDVSLEGVAVSFYFSDSCLEVNSETEMMSLKLNGPKLSPYSTELIIMKVDSVPVVFIRQDFKKGEKILKSKKADVEFKPADFSCLINRMALI